jgi:hypothetical protein
MVIQIAPNPHPYGADANLRRISDCRTIPVGQQDFASLCQQRPVHSWAYLTDCQAPAERPAMSIQGRSAGAVEQTSTKSINSSLLRELIGRSDDYIFKERNGPDLLSPTH